jgi:hypothetical protein
VSACGPAGEIEREQCEDGMICGQHFSTMLIQLASIEDRLDMLEARVQGRLEELGEE